jgi:acyl transferase domain-containing protein
MQIESVSIVGVGGLFPMSPTPNHFWDNINANLDTSRRPPEGRWLLEPDEVFDPGIGVPDRVYSKKGCFIDDDTEALSLEGLNPGGTQYCSRTT